VKGYGSLAGPRGVSETQISKDVAALKDRGLVEVFDDSKPYEVELTRQGMAYVIQDRDGGTGCCEVQTSSDAPLIRAHKTLLRFPFEADVPVESRRSFLK